TKEAWRRDRKNTFALYAPPESYVDHVLAFAKAKGLRRVALVYAKSGVAREVADGVKTRLADLGMHLVLEQDYDKDTSDFSAVIGKLKTRRPDVLIAASYTAEAVAFQRQAKENKFSAKIMALVPGGSSPEFGALGADANGVFGVVQWEPMFTASAEFVRK